MAMLADLIFIGLAASVSAVPFFYYNVPTTDSKYERTVDTFKELLKNEGIIDPSEIKAISRLQIKNELYRKSYQVDFYTTSGRECHYKWREVRYSSAFIADHSCTKIAKVLPPRTKPTTTTTTTEEPPTADSHSEEDDTTDAPEAARAIGNKNWNRRKKQNH